MVDQIVVRIDYERDALELLKKQSFGHAKRFELLFLITMGLKQDVNHVFTAAGWENFTDITETGSHLLTMEFLPTFHVVAKMASHAIFQYNVLAIDDTHNTWTNMIVKMNIPRLLGSSDDKEKIGVTRPEGPPLTGLRAAP